MKSNIEDIKKLENILRTKPNIQIPEWKESLLYEKPKYSKDSIFYYRTVALLLFIFTLGLYFYQLQLLYKKIEKLQTITDTNKNAIGIVVYVKGDGYVLDQERNLKKIYVGTLVYSNYSLETKSNSIIELLLDKRIYIRIDSNTKIQLQNQNLTWKFIQEKGISYHDVKLLNKENYYLETPTTIARIRGTFLKIENQTNFTKIEVLKGNVEVYRKQIDEGQILSLVQEEILERNHSFLLSNKEKKLIKNEKNQNLIVIYNEMVKNKQLFFEELWEEIKKIPQTQNKEEIEQVYNKRIEIIHLKDGRTLEGVIASQIEQNLILHTTQGIIVVKIDEIKEIIYK